MSHTRLHHWVAELLHSHDGDHVAERPFALPLDLNLYCEHDMERQAVSHSHLISEFLCHHRLDAVSKTARVDPDLVAQCSDVVHGFIPPLNSFSIVLLAIRRC